MNIVDHTELQAKCIEQSGLITGLKLKLMTVFFTYPVRQQMDVQQKKIIEYKTQALREKHTVEQQDYTIKQLNQNIEDLQRQLSGARQQVQLSAIQAKAISNVSQTMVAEKTRAPEKNWSIFGGLLLLLISVDNNKYVTSVTRTTDALSNLVRRGARIPVEKVFFSFNSFSHEYTAQGSRRGGVCFG